MDKIKDCIYNEFCELECKPTCLKYVEMKYLLKTSNIPQIKQKINKLIPDNADLIAYETLANIRDNIENFVLQGKNLFIYSGVCGNGKTTWSIKLLLQYFNEIWAGNGFNKRGIFLNVPTFLAKCKAVISTPDKNFEDLKNSIVNVDLLILDDIATSQMSNYDYSILLSYIDQRLLNEKSIIFTSNVSPNKLNEILGDRISSRVCGSNTTIVELVGGDKR